MNVRVRKRNETPGESHSGQREKTELRRKLRNNSQMQEKNQEELDPCRMERTFCGIRVVAPETTEVK